MSQKNCKKENITSDETKYNKSVKIIKVQDEKLCENKLFEKTKNINVNSESESIDNDIKLIKNHEKLNVKTHKTIIEPCKIPEFIDIITLKEYVKKDLDSNKEYFDDLNITYRISDPKKAEWILSKSIKNCKLIGDGNKNIDISVNDKIGIDVSVLTLRGNLTNEKSIMQNFSNSNDLDTLFNTNAGEKAVEIFKNKFIEKCKFKDNKNKEIYYIIFICINKNVYISCLRLNPENIPNMKFSEFSRMNKNIIIENFIDKEFGNVKLYKSKKRLELRLCKEIINNECSMKLF